jgi:hypothetical protein
LLTRFELGLLLPAGALALLAAPGVWHAAPGLVVSRSAAMAVGFLPAALSWTAFAWHTFGTPLPTTFLSKASSLSLNNAVTVRSIVVVLGTSLGPPAVLAAAVLWTRARSHGWSAARALPAPVLVSGFFALLCVLFYGVAVREFQSAARYLLPTIYALSIGVGGLVASGLGPFGPSTVWRRAIVGVAAVQAVVMLVVHYVAVVPVLRGFQDNYWRASREAAAFLIEEVTPGETVFAVSDIGMLAYYARDRYRVIDGPGLAAPSLVGLGPQDILVKSGARLVVEHYGRSDSERLPLSPDAGFARVRAFPFAAAGLISPEEHYSLNVYRRGP